ncbi:MAG: hypothetical protein LBN39_00660 [Planctomycetaceae bacterium]|jgi:L-alanine-DL-glutamate epimerase-like enolase superfamily enzyme|nr:hypothetical protein [Planctomycetaceae bacterium]
MKLRVVRVDLPLKHVFATSKRSISVVRSVMVELEQDGLRGYGEVYEDTFYGMYIEDIAAVITKCKDYVERYALADPIAFMRHLDPALKKNKFAQCAVDCAACDLWGKMKNKPLWKIWGLTKDRLPVSSYTLGLDSIDRMEERLAEQPDWSIYRIKLGEKDDMNILAALRQKTKAAFYVDVNGGWNVKTAIQNLEPMQRIGVELLEQPLPADDWDGMAKLKKEMKKRNITFPVFADESWRTVDDIDKCAEVFDGINVKLNKCGGLNPARQVMAKVKHLGLRLSSANTVESTIGVSATAQLAPLLNYIGADGPLQIEKKVGVGVRAENGKLVYPPDESGTGARGPFR